MQAQIYHGRPNLLMDHLQLGLRVPGEDEPRVYLSLYVIPWSRELGAGHVALVRLPPRETGGTGGAGKSGSRAGERQMDATLSDNPTLARALQAQLRSVGYSRVDLTSDPRPASFTRSPLREQHHVRFLIASMGFEIEARWEDLGEPIFAAGPAPQQPTRQEIWSMLFEAQDASLAINGRPIEGEPYQQEHWQDWLGRSLCSAHIARGEILVDRPVDGSGWTGSARKPG